MKIKLITLVGIAACIGSVSAQSVSFSFGTDTWNYASGSPTTGFVNQTPANTQTQSSGSVTKSGVTMKFGASFAGSTTSGDNYGGLTSGSSLTFAPSGQNPAGFLLTSEFNDSTSLPNGISSALNSGSITTYQRWYFEFSSPVSINSFLIQDIDNIVGNQFRDILGAEGYGTSGFTTAFVGNTLNTAALPTAGSGINPTFGFQSPTELALYNLTVGSESLAVVSPNVDTGNPSSDPKHRVNVGFGSTPIRAFSIYAISNDADNHRMSLDNGVFQITVIPEPSGAMLALISVTGLLLRRRRV